MSAHEFEFTAIDGRKMSLAEFAGKPVLVVNTASECGLTPQYRGLQALWERYRERGLVVLGVPCNDFGGQEPGTEAEIKDFCTSQYRVGFPMTAKNAVIGKSAHPFYRWAVEQGGAAPSWNFHKYLLDGTGALAATFASRVAPDDKALVAEIEAHLPK
ncbi:MAG TPA: glutathione peroxidase [Stellaceae bacterium]|nr:glutathione peroxidase [Stellaceae bacterium]